jgi:EAL domain-containing protein (putative c-di-GMP-specific phosphodiesterase class I)/PAS domain-containing protein
MRKIRLRPLLSALLPIALCVMLLGTIYLTLFDWEWIAFLSGIFAAAVIALSSKATSAEWLLARRAKQIGKLKENLSLQTAQVRGAEARLADSDGRNRILYDSIDCLLAYVDTKQVCQFHNLGFASAVGSPDAPVNGRTLRDVLGDAAHARIGIGLHRVLGGKNHEFEATLTLCHGGAGTYNLRLIPHCRANGTVHGCWVLLGQANAFSGGSQAWGDLRLAGRSAAAPEATGENAYLDSMADDLTGWADPKAHLLQALEQNRFRMLYQPIRAATRGLTGPDYAEILVRLQEEERSLLPPGAFFPVAERYHLMSALDRWVICTLLDWYKNKRRAGVFPRFCVNLSRDSIVDETFAEFLRGEIERNTLPGIVLCFELAEVDVIAHPFEAIRLTSELSAMGNEITIDGFGGSSSSFSYLQDMTVKFLKIDGSIIANIHRDPVSLAKARAIARAAHWAQRFAIAELVETQDTFDALLDLGVDYVQGFGIAKPRELSELETIADASDLGVSPLGAAGGVVGLETPLVSIQDRHRSAGKPTLAEKTGTGR